MLEPLPFSQTLEPDVPEKTSPAFTHSPTYAPSDAVMPVAVPPETRIFPPDATVVLVTVPPDILPPGVHALQWKHEGLATGPPGKPLPKPWDYGVAVSLTSVILARM